MTNPSNPSKKQGNLPAALALSASIVAGMLPNAAAAGEPGEAGRSPVRSAEATPVVVATGAVAGRIIEPDGLAAVVGAKVTVHDEAGKLVAESKTDKDGRYDLGKLAAGRYTFRCGRASGKLFVQDGAEARTLTLVLPGAIALATPIRSAQEQVEKKETLLGIEGDETTIMAIGVGLAAVAVGAGVGIAIAADDGSSNRAASPSAP